MPIKILISLLFLSCVGCQEYSLDEKYELGIEHFFNNLPYPITDDIFKNEICYISSKIVNQDQEINDYLNITYIENDLSVKGIVNDDMVITLLRKHFKTVENCDSIDPNKSIRKFCKGKTELCILISPIYHDKKEKNVRFLLSAPPIYSVEIVISDENKVEIENLQIY